MTELLQELYAPLPERYRSAEKTAAKSGSKRGRWIVVIAVWLVLIAGAYYAAQHYIGGLQVQLRDIKAGNEAQIQSVNANVDELKAQVQTQQENAAALLERIGSVESSLETVKEELSLAGDSINASDKTKQALNNRISDLSKELTELRKLIKKLEEAARVY